MKWWVGPSVNCRDGSRREGRTRFGVPVSLYSRIPEGSGKDSYLCHEPYMCRTHVHRKIKSREITSKSFLDVCKVRYRKRKFEKPIGEKRKNNWWWRSSTTPITSGSWQKSFTGLRFLYSVTRSRLSPVYFCRKIHQRRSLCSLSSKVQSRDPYS